DAPDHLLMKPLRLAVQRNDPAEIEARERLSFGAEPRRLVVGMGDPRAAAEKIDFAVHEKRLAGSELLGHRRIRAKPKEENASGAVGKRHFQAHLTPPAPPSEVPDGVTSGDDLAADHDRSMRRQLD